MKKIISVLILLASVMMLSGCFWVINDDEDYSYQKYNFYFYNDSDYKIRDWYLEDVNHNQYSRVNDGYANPIESGELHTIKDLRKRDYRVFYEYLDAKDDKHQYYSNYFTLSSDTTFKVSDKHFHDGRPRSAESDVE